MNSPAISVRGISVSYERKLVLTNIYLDFEPGHAYGIIGPNGAGKSTLFKAILGLVSLNSGQVFVFGDEMDEHRKRVVYVPQKNEVDWSFPATVFDVVLMGRYPHKRIFQSISKSDKKMAEEALEELGITQLRESQIGELSGGQQQRVFLARALCQQADIFLLDEPFVGVDMTTEEKIIQLLQRLAEGGKTILVIHHDLSTVPAYFDRVVLLNQRLIAAGKTEEVFTEKNISQAYSGQIPILHQIK
ncbi:MAG: metal ABC transporter ATP-binding protein [Saprospiraceae bacterium]|nr:metal ABC transporter ATP-binding protein [Saprospiraceae bacterium]